MVAINGSCREGRLRRVEQIGILVRVSVGWMRVRDTWFDVPADSAYRGASVDEKVMISELSARSSLEQVRMRHFWI